MPIFHALVLGIVQGLTEYIPVSSTAHLLLVPWLFGWTTTPAFTILVQWGTLVGVAIYFWRDIWTIVQRKPLGTPEARLGWWIVVATIPAVIVGVIIKKYLDVLYTQYVLIAIILIAAAGLLFAAERWSKRTRELDTMNAKDAGLIGVWQLLAFLPGVSRSSATISGGMFQGFERANAARFSFLLSIPALLGAGVLALKDLFDSGELATYAAPLLVGFLAAAISGYFVIRWLLGFLKTRPMNVFAWYRIVFGAICVLVALTHLR
jgi:undecaprenyl-diphosphatase